MVFGMQTPAGGINSKENYDDDTDPEIHQLS